MDPVTGYCYGCGRNNDEKKIWKDQNTNDEWKKQNLEDIQKRMEGWQLASFKESYEHKLQHGICSTILRHILHAVKDIVVK